MTADVKKAILGELLKRFPWVTEDEPVSGADVVDAVCEWYEELEKETKSTKRG